MMNKKFNFHILIFTFFILSTIVVYYPGLAPGFHFDDYPNIVDNQLLQPKSLTFSNLWQAAWSGASSSFGRPLAYLSFSLNTYISGLDARMMKVTNLVIHLLTGILLFFTSRIVFNYLYRSNQIKYDGSLICAIVCGVWLLHPINLTAVIYVVQRMTSLAALFSVCAILSYTYFRTQQIQTRGHWTPLILFTLLFAALSFLVKETAVLLLFYISCIEIFIFRFSTFNKLDKSILKFLYVAVYAISAAVVIVVLMFNSEWLMKGYEHRTFNLAERLLTESRIIVWYIKMIIAPNIAEMGLYLDDFELSTSLFQPITTFISLILLSLLIIVSYKLRNNFVLLSFGIIWFMTGHILESTVIPLELIFEHRNYLPSYGILIAVIYALSLLVQNNKIKPIIIVTTVMWVSLITYTTFSRAEHWKDALTLALAHVEYHPNSVRAHSTLAGTYSEFAKADDGKINEEIFSKADYHFKKASELEICCSANMVGRLTLYSQHQMMLPKNEFNEIVKSLKEKPLDPGTQSGLQGLTKCLIDNECKLPTKDYMTIMYAPISRIQPEHNPLPNDKNLMPGVIILLSEYYSEVLNDYNTAKQLMKNIIDEHPEKIHFRFTLIKILVQSGQLREALDELNVIEDQDKYGFYTANSNSWRSLIDSLSTKAN